MKELMFDIKIALLDREDEVYRKNFIIESKADEKETAKEFVLSLEKVKKIEYGKDFLYLRVNRVICRTTTIEEIFNDEIPTKIIKCGNLRNEKIQTNLQEQK